MHQCTGTSIPVCECPGVCTCVFQCTTVPLYTCTGVQVECVAAAGWIYTNCQVWGEICEALPVKTGGNPSDILAGNPPQGPTPWEEIDVLGQVRLSQAASLHKSAGIKVSARNWYFTTDQFLSFLCKRAPFTCHESIGPPIRGQDILLGSDKWKNS